MDETLSQIIGKINIVNASGGGIFLILSISIIYLLYAIPKIKKTVYSFNNSLRKEMDNISKNMDKYVKYSDLELFYDKLDKRLAERLDPFSRQIDSLSKAIERLNQNLFDLASEKK